MPKGIHTRGTPKGVHTVDFLIWRFGSESDFGVKLPNLFIELILHIAEARLETSPTVDRKCRYNLYASP